MTAEQALARELPGLAAAHAEFTGRYPQFAATTAVDRLRASEYGRLDAAGQVYLDYTGGGLYADCQLREHMQLLGGTVFGNPHSGSGPSKAATALVERARAAVLDYFSASAAEYEVIFTPNATGALRLVGESYPFSPDGCYLLTFDNHNSVNGIREFALAAGAAVRYIAVQPPDLRAAEAGSVPGTAAPDADPASGSSIVQSLAEGLANVRPGGNLFAYPAQSNFSGVQHPLEWIEVAQAAGWDVLLDAAAFAPTNRLDLSRWKPDFVTLSFYKMFGYPTGIGALLARKPALAKLRRPWFGGGNLVFSTVQAFEHGIARAAGPDGFEDGTLDYLSIPAVETGLRHLSRVGIDVVHTRVHCLTGWMLGALAALRHADGAPLVRVYGPQQMEGRGGTIAFNIIDQAGLPVDSRVVEQRANAAGIALRSGCHCNPGAGEIALGCTGEQMATWLSYRDRLSYEEFLHLVDGVKTGAARVSAGLATTFADVYRFVDFAASFRDDCPPGQVTCAVPPPSLP